jgi:OmpA-OmpF porin, OOP family
MKTNHTTLRVSLIAVAVSLTLAGCSTRMGQQQNGSTVPADRQQITDKAIQERYERYEVMQTRIKQLNDTGKFPVASYSMSKAQCWLDVSFHEYTRNDRSNFPRLAFEESAKIVEYLGKGGAPSAAANPANSTPLVNDAAKLRQDLWDAANKLKGHVGFNCAAQKVACAEVELAHAGNEFNQQQWRHAKPYVQIAEDLIGDAQKAADACIPPPAPVVAVAPTPKPAPAPVVVPPTPPEPITLQANVLFNFDKRTLAEVRPYTKDQLNSMLARLKRDVTVKEVRLVGHADRLNSTGDKNYNAKLSQDRVQVIKDYLVANGVAANQITTEFKADTQPIEACTKAKFASQAELQECLLPNRRVEVELVGLKKP